MCNNGFYLDICMLVANGDLQVWPYQLKNILSKIHLILQGKLMKQHIPIYLIERPLGFERNFYIDSRT
jgi:hypothetical protein